MTQQIQLLFARGLSRVERSVLGRKRLRFPEMLSVFLKLIFGVRE